MKILIVVLIVVCALACSTFALATRKIVCSTGTYQYSIKSSDSCYSIGITQTAAANQGINCNNLQVGQVVCVPNNVITTTQQSSTSCAQGTYAYTIKSGDTCNLLGISAASAQAQGLNCQNLQIGQVVCASYYIQSTTTASNGKSCGANSYLYTVRSGDTCYSLRITQAYASSNNINCSPLQPGQSICLPLTLFTSTVYYTTTTTMPYLSIYCGLNTYSYTIKNGDSCFSLGITQELAKAQNINCNLLQVGQTICAPYYTSPNTPSTTLVCSTNYYTVKPGDSCQSISASRNYLYTDLIALNGGTLNCNALSPNQVICV